MAITLVGSVVVASSIMEYQAFVEENKKKKNTCMFAYFFIYWYHLNHRRYNPHPKPKGYNLVHSPLHT